MIANSMIRERYDNAGRIATHWWPLHWTSPLDGERPRPISLFDLAELRAVVDTNRVATGLEPMLWVGRTDDDPTFLAEVTPIRAVHFTQLRAAVADLWQIGGLGDLPEFRAGPIVPHTRRISLRDPQDLRTWLEAYEDARPDLAARVVWRPVLNPAALYPLLPWIPGRPTVEMWDGSGHSVVLEDPSGTSLTELRRIDTRWYVTLVKDHRGDPTATVTLVPFSSDGTASSDLDDSASVGLDKISMREVGGASFPSWEPEPIDLEAGWTVERDPLGRIVRVRDGDRTIARLAYDGLGRLRKLIDATNWHVLGPNLKIPVLHGMASTAT